ncbi:hypothetical protein J6P59_03200 [bacterium]|nr:hypothetical protein [bacterium]
MNGQPIGQIYNSIPSTLPSYDLEKTTTFNLLISNDIDSNLDSFISNSIVINPINENFTATLTASYLNENSTSNDPNIIVYSNQLGSNNATSNDITFILNLFQNGTKYTGTVNNNLISLSFTSLHQENNETVEFESNDEIANNTLTFTVPIN